MKQGKRAKLYWGMAFVGSLLGVLSSNPLEIEAANGLGGPSHIGTFEGSTTFMTSSSNGINPGLYLEVMDEYGNYHEYTSEDGVITIPNTQEGAYVTQAKLLGKTKYVDQDTGELLDQWEEGRNLKLESVEKPALTTIGKNVWDTDEMNVSYDSGLKNIEFSNTSIKLTNNYQGWRGFVFENEKNFNYLSFNVSANRVNDTTKYIRVEADGTQVGRYDLSKGRITIRLPQNSQEIKVQVLSENGVDTDFEFTDIQLESEAFTKYEPYQSSILSVNEDIALRGNVYVNGKLREDALDLVSGERQISVGEAVLNGSENWNVWYHTDTLLRFMLNYSNMSTLTNIKLKCDKIPSYGYNQNAEGLYGNGGTLYLIIDNSSNKLLGNTINNLKMHLSQNPITVQYPLKEKSIKTVTLNSTYYFKPVNTREILVEGSIMPLICSVTTPTDPLSFVLNPNAEGEDQFIAPDFTITNQTKASVSVELKQFKQVTDVLNDVLPNKYVDWSGLNKTQSKDIALALVPQPSEGWESLLEGPRYVADDSNYEIGEIKAKSSVDFTFTAKHGSAFIESLSPRYRLVLVFDF